MGSKGGWEMKERWVVEEGGWWGRMGGGGGWAPGDGLYLLLGLFRVAMSPRSTKAIGQTSL